MVEKTSRFRFYPTIERDLICRVEDPSNYYRVAKRVTVGVSGTLVVRPHGATSDDTIYAVAGKPLPIEIDAIRSTSTAEQVQVDWNPTCDVMRLSLGLALERLQAPLGENLTGLWLPWDIESTANVCEGWTAREGGANLADSTANSFSVDYADWGQLPEIYADDASAKALGSIASARTLIVVAEIDTLPASRAGVLASGAINDDLMLVANGASAWTAVAGIARYRNGSASSNLAEGRCIYEASLDVADEEIAIGGTYSTGADPFPGSIMGILTADIQMAAWQRAEVIAVLRALCNVTT